MTIYDTLSPALKASSFQLLGSSHSVETELTKQGVVKFKFRNIMLVDSTTDKANAQGWVRFAVEPKGAIAEGEKISNTAAIVFDSNPAIITNTVSNTMVTKLPVVLAVNDATKEHRYFFPNPVKDELQIPGEVVSTEIYNSLGKLIIYSNATSIDVSHLNSGLYLVKSFDKTGKISENKLIKY